MDSERKDAAINELLAGAKKIIDDENLDGLRKVIGLHMILVAADVILQSEKFHDGKCPCFRCAGDVQSGTIGLGGANA